MTSLELAPAWSPPPSFGGFEILESLGEGGMGRVFLARDTSLERLVALKFMNNPANADALARFKQEARALARLNHPNVVDVYRIDEVDGHPFIVYEYVHGRSLDRVAKPIRWQAALVIATGAARGLAAAHRAGLLHRDIKPANVMLSISGEVKLVDFGLARVMAGIVQHAPDGGADEPLLEPVGELAQPNAVAFVTALASLAARTAPSVGVGTPRYWAPEQWLRGKVDAKTDIYALGLVLYELLDGAPPFAEVAGSDLLHAIVEVGVPLLRARGVPEGLSALVDRCLQRDPQKRPESSTELARELAQLQRYFVPAAPEALTRPLSVEAALLTSSWSRVLPWRAALIARIYDDLFASDPEVRALFPKDLAAQHDKIVQALDLALHGLSDPETITPVLRDLGRRHVGHGVDRRHFDLLGKALLGALPVFDSEWNDETKQAWEHAFGFVAATMLAGMSSEQNASPSTAPPSGAPVPHTPLEMPRTLYAASGNVAYQELGGGPALVFVPGRVTHVEMTWSHSAPMWLLTRMASFSRVFLVDLRGSGMSDRIPDPTVDDGVDDILAVLDKAGVGRSVLVGAGDAGPICIAAAARHPERTAALVLFNSTPCPMWTEDFPCGRTKEQLEELVKVTTDEWGSPAHVQRENPTAGRDRTFAEWLASYQRIAAGQRRAIAMLRTAHLPDVRPLLGSIQAPTLVLHRAGDEYIPADAGRYVAGRVAHGRLIELSGNDHSIWAGNTAELARAIERFLAGLSKTYPS